MPSSISCQSRSVMLPARSSAQYFHVSRAAAERAGRASCRAASGRRHEDRRQVHADRAHQQRRAWSCRSRPSAPRRRPDRSAAAPRSPSRAGCGTASSSASGTPRTATIAGISSGKAARLPDAALHLLGALAEMRVARVDVAPRVDDRDDRLAGVVARANSPSARCANDGRTSAGR